MDPNKTDAYSWPFRFLDMPCTVQGLFPHVMLMRSTAAHVLCSDCASMLAAKLLQVVLNNTIDTFCRGSLHVASSGPSLGSLCQLLETVVTQGTEAGSKLVGSFSLPLDHLCELLDLVHLKAQSLQGHPILRSLLMFLGDELALFDDIGNCISLLFQISSHRCNWQTCKPSWLLSAQAPGDGDLSWQHQGSRCWPSWPQPVPPC